MEFTIRDDKWGYLFAREMRICSTNVLNFSHAETNKVIVFCSFWNISISPSFLHMSDFSLDVRGYF